MAINNLMSSEIPSCHISNSMPTGYPLISERTSIVVYIQGAERSIRVVSINPGNCVCLILSWLWFIPNLSGSEGRIFRASWAYIKDTEILGPFLPQEESQIYVLFQSGEMVGNTNILSSAYMAGRMSHPHLYDGNLSFGKTSWYYPPILVLRFYVLRIDDTGYVSDSIGNLCIPTSTQAPITHKAPPT